MPLVIISKNYRVSRKVAENVATHLPRITARALSVVGEGRLAPKEVEVWIRNSGHDDRNTRRDLRIVIFANSYPARNENLEERAREIAKMVHRYVPPKVKSYVWILLSHSAFHKF